MSEILSFKREIPQPTFKNPLAQVEWIFKERMIICDNKATQKNYRTSLSYYKRFLSQTNNYNLSLKEDPRFYLNKEWDETALFKLWKWIEATNIRGKKGYITSSTLGGNIAVIRQVMSYAYENNYIEKPVINIAVPPAYRETDIRKAFSQKEYDSVLTAVLPMLNFADKLTKTYIPTNKGKDPRIKIRKGHDRGKKLTGEGWGCWQEDSEGNYTVCDDNIRWYFENVMKCEPSASNSGKHISFFQMAANLFGGVNNLYEKWGVTSTINQNILLPLLVKLIAETGLNVESILSLKRNCFNASHTLTGLPYLEYTKPRSGGEKELHIAIYDRNEKTLMGLKQKQSRIIAKTIETILKLTSPLVEKAKVEDKDCLFLYETNCTKYYKKVKAVNFGIIKHWTKNFTKVQNLKSDSGKPLVFTLSRFRPTKITKMVLEGYDFFDVMAVAGHSSVHTTLAYIDKQNFTGNFHKEMTKELIIIKENKREYERNPLPIAKNVNDKPGNFIFKGAVCHCKNPYNPPQIVRQSKTYQEGNACTYFNMCLQCENVLITEMDLPKLIAYRNEIRLALNNLNEIPRQGELYKRIMFLIAELLEAERIFSKDQINFAEEIAKQNDFDVIDSFISRTWEH